MHMHMHMHMNKITHMYTRMLHMHMHMNMHTHMHMHMHVHMHMGTQVWSRTTRSGRRTTRRCGTKRRRSARQRQLVRCTGAANTPIAIEGCSS